MQYDFQQFKDLGQAQEYATKRAADGWRVVTFTPVQVSASVGNRTTLYVTEYLVALRLGE